jgi:hypothetical protein
MYERCLNEAERILASSKEIVLPIKQVWKNVVAEGKRRSFIVPSQTDFDALLEGDRRFEIISARVDADESDSLIQDEDVDASLGTLGFYPEDRVKLRRIKLPRHHADDEVLSKEDEANEDVEPFIVRGLSTTRPIPPTRKGNRKSVRKSTKTSSRTTPSVSDGSKSGARSSRKPSRSVKTSSKKSR